ncbi:hypothetical protein [Thalassoglobus polymorphus]|uniref:Tetratricopeptide repeat protein n=1 Tax=Thalassoglobus polymorphus TaxID=2527994 RepID=A0A517QQ44_9PLAN|nr:hypothetical protein [Thalassoglobus polymorphus]QDT33760.1 hypothetical protein Mal48_30150 [Thalassoglobus polymorphus]
MPKVSEESARKDWSKFFSKNRPYPVRIRQWVMKLHQEGKHKTVIGCLESALIQGQAQPWMYEVLALSMEIENYPRQEIERVVLSLSDFGAVTFDNLIYSAAYLTRFNRKSAALGLYQQASRLAPERHEPYMLSLKLAKDVGDSNDVIWAATGVLQYYWGKDYMNKHRDAENIVVDRIQQLEKEGNQEQAQQLQSQLSQCLARDLMIRVDWSGAGDLDLYVEEPLGAVCSFETPLTIAGGIFMHDGAGPDQANCYESYVCPQGVTGPYQIRVKKSFGEVVGNRATVTVLINAGTPEEEKIVRTVVFNDEESGFTIDLPNGRRTQPRNLSQLEPTFRTQLSMLNTAPLRFHHVKSLNERKAKVHQQFAEDRLTPTRRAGAVGYAPVVQTIPEGTSMTAQAVVSPDRRYVRLSLQPSITNVTDVFTFSYLNNGNANGGNVGGN